MEDWRTTLPVQGVGLDGATPVISGVLDTVYGPQVVCASASTVEP